MESDANKRDATNFYPLRSIRTPINTWRTALPFLICDILVDYTMTQNNTGAISPFLSKSYHKKMH